MTGLRVQRVRVQRLRSLLPDNRPSERVWGGGAMHKVMHKVEQNRVFKYITKTLTLPRPVRLRLYEVGGVEECIKKADMQEEGARFPKMARNSLCGQESSTDSFSHILIIDT